jgi:3-oxoacyl-[acyl-carrier protein] reductase
MRATGAAAPLQKGHLMDLSNKTAIVTGSATGLGASVALKLAARKANLVINYTKSEAEAKETKEACEKAGSKAIMVQADVSNDTDCQRLAKEAIDAFGGIDILVNNAGISKFANHAKLDELSSEDFHKIYDVNVVGAYQMIRAAAPSMKERGYGAVVNISSIAGVVGIGSSVAYAASKGALNTMTISLARALAPEIRVNAVCPGFIETRWFIEKAGQEVFDAVAKQNRETSPLKKSAPPDDIADSVVFLATEGSNHITGETLIVDAGTHLGFAPLVAR